MLKRPQIMDGFQASVNTDSVEERVPGCLISSPQPSDCLMVR